MGQRKTKRRLVGRIWHFANVKEGSAAVVDTTSGIRLGRVKLYKTASGAPRWSAFIKRGRSHLPVGTRRSRREAGALVSWKARG